MTKNLRRKFIKVIKSNFFINVITIVLIALLVFLFFIPIVFNFQAAIVAGKVFMVIGSVAFFAIHVSIFICQIIIRRTEKKALPVTDILFYVGILLTYCYLILRYIDRDIWGTLTAFYGFAGIFILVFGLYSIIKHFDILFNKERLPMIILSIAIVLVFMGLTTKDEELKDHTLYIKIGIGILYAIIIVAFLHLTIYGKEKKNKEKHRFMSILMRITIPVAVLLTIPYYVQWCGLDGGDFNTFLQVYAAVVGGGLTLVGVAWTIQKNKDERNDELKRLEKERKEDEIKKYKPIFNLLAGVKKVHPIYIHELPENDTFSLTNKVGEEYYLKDFAFGNTDFIAFYFKGIRINNETLLRKDNDLYIEKLGEYGLLSQNKTFFYTGEINDLYLILEDLLENRYSAKLKWEQKEISVNKNSTGDVSTVHSIHVIDIEKAVLEKEE